EAAMASRRVEDGQAPAIGPYAHRALRDTEVLRRLPERQPRWLGRTRARTAVRRLAVSLHVTQCSPDLGLRWARCPIHPFCDELQRPLMTVIVRVATVSVRVTR